MDRLQKYVIQTYKKAFQVLDSIGITRGLCKLGLLSTAQKNFIFPLASSTEARTIIWEKLLPIFQEQFTFTQILKCGYIELFLEIFLHIRSMKCEGRNAIAVRRSTSSRRFSQDLLINFKLHAYNYIFDDPKEYFHEKSVLYKTAYLSETSPEERMRKADTYAVSLCTEIDVRAFEYPKKVSSQGFFEKLKDLIPHTSNTHVTQLLYDTRMATAYAIADKEEMADEYILSGISSSLFLGYCIEIVNIIYVCVYSLLCKYEKYPNKALLDKIIKIAHFGLQCLQEEEEDTIRDFSRRRFYLRMAFCLLGIRNRGDIVPGCIVLPENVTFANEMLVEIDKTWSSIEARRQMFYCVAKARIVELENTVEGMEFAIQYIKMAVDIAKEGNFGERKYIESYANSLKVR